MGIPCPTDVGQHYLELTAKGPSNSASATFVLVVREVPSHTSGVPLKFKKESSGAEFVRCKRSEPETVATIILDVDIELMQPTQRLSLLNKFLNHMNLHEDMVKMIPVGKSAMHDDNALVSGSGDCMSPKTTGTFMSWPVGCGQVKSGHFSILQRMDEDATSGKMAKVLDQSVIGWHVVNSHIQAPKRKRRQALATATPVLSPTMPSMTATDVDSGEEAFTREVPGMSSPVIQPTSTQPDMPQTTSPMPTEPDVKPMDPEPKDTKPENTPMIQPTTSYIPDMPKSVVTEMLTCTSLKANSVPTRRINEGDLIDFVIPADTFEGCSATINARDLSLSLKMANGDDLPSFVSFDKKNQKIIGLPLKEDVRKDKYAFKLIGEKNSEGYAIREETSVSIKIKGMKNVNKVNHKISATLDLDYDAFKANVSQQYELALKVASIYGDKDLSNLLITQMDRGSVIYGWANKSLTSNDCPVDGISDVAGALAQDGKLSQEAIDKMYPYTLHGLSIQPQGKCEGAPGFPVVEIDNRPEKSTISQTTEDKAGETTPETTKSKVPTEGTDPSETTMVGGGEGDPEDPKTYSVDGNVDLIPEFIPETTEGDKPDDDKTDEEKPAVTTEMDKDKEKVGSAGAGNSDNVLITTVVPAIVIVVILLFALLIACVLYRKKRKGNLNVEEQNTFVNKGAPVIFPNELEDKPNDVTKPLLVEGGNGNAGPPPEYHRGDSAEPEGLSARNNGNNINGLLGDDDIQHERYEPPTPPVTGTSNRHTGPAERPGFSQAPQILP